MRKIGEQDVRKIYKHNQSYVITLPIAVVRGLGWKEGQKLTLKRSGQGILVEDWQE